MSLLEPKGEKDEESQLLWAGLILPYILIYHYFGWIGIGVLTGLVILVGLIVRKFRK